MGNKFSDKLKKSIQEAHAIENGSQEVKKVAVKKMEEPKKTSLKAKVYKVIKSFRGTKKSVAFGLFHKDAEILISHARRQIERLAPTYIPGDPIFEGPTFEIVEEA